VARPQATTLVLFIGNSFMMKNKLVQVFQRISAAEGRTVFVDQSLFGGASLSDQVNRFNALDHVYAQNWTAVVFQEQSLFLSLGLSFAQAHTYVAAKEIFDGIKAIPQRRAILFETWGYLGGDPARYTLQDTEQAMQARIHAGYTALAAFLGDCEVCPVGSGPWATASATLGANSVLLYSDYEHPSPWGTYIAALRVYKQVFGVAAKSSSYRPPRVTAAQATQARAWVHASA
jgi:hypothetical protein